MNPPAQTKMLSDSHLGVGGEKRENEQRKRTCVMPQWVALSHLRCCFPATEPESKHPWWPRSGDNSTHTFCTHKLPIRATRREGEGRKEGKKKRKEERKETIAFSLPAANFPQTSWKYSPHPSPAGVKPRMPGAASLAARRPGYRDLNTWTWGCCLAWHMPLSLQPLLRS